jgi:hypothetical protein
MPVNTQKYSCRYQRVLGAAFLAAGALPVVVIGPMIPTSLWNVNGVVLEE